MRLLGYVRVSTDDQARGGHSITRQPDLLHAWCDANGHELVDVIVDGDFGDGTADNPLRGVSAAQPLAKRQGGQELLARLRAGEADGVVVYSVFRLFRDTEDGLWFFRRFAKPLGLQVHSLSEAIDVARASGRFALTVLLATAEYERDTTCERTQAIAQGLRERGRVYGHVPYGCTAVDGALFRDPIAWGIREEIVQWRTTDGLTLSAISAVLRTRRILAPNGGRTWSKSTLAELVRSHESLAHLPVLEGKGAMDAKPVHDAPASQGESEHATHH